MNEVEGVGGELREVDESGCRAAGETPGKQRYEQMLVTVYFDGKFKIKP